MGVKSTTTLTRSAAEDLYVRLKMEDKKIERQFRAEAVLMNDTELENELERLNDARYENGWGGFDNYLIRSHSDD